MVVPRWDHTGWLVSFEPLGPSKTRPVQGQCFGSEWGPLGIWEAQFEKCPSLPLPSPKWPLLFCLCCLLGVEKTWKFESTKNRQSTQWVDQKCMLFKHVFSGICFSPKETCTLQKCIFSKWASLTLDCFLPFAGRSKNKISQKAPFWFFLGS